MREILFRGKRIDNGEWVYGWYVGYSESMGYIYGDYIDKDEVWQVDASSVSQYTGLKDKNNERIFESDVLRVFGYKYVVKFGMHEANNGWYAETEDGVICELNDSFSIAEVISTIHDSPELLG